MKRYLQILISIFLVAYLWNCAKVGTIDGGPREYIPPRVVRTKPVNGALNFSGKRIEITFDEYLNTDDLSEELVISPPSGERIQTRMRGKTLIVELDDTLRDHTTYTLSFGNGIKDLNEGNILKNYEFIFSTGDHLDSLGVTGMVLQAIDLEPVGEAVFISLYSNLSDSAPYQEIPDYTGKATPEGAFIINNVHPGTYRLFALQDMNMNFRYDVPGEQIGFLDTLIILQGYMFEYIPPTPEPTTGAAAFEALVDTGFSMADTALVAGDSVSVYDLARYSVMVDVFTFIEDNEPQYLIDNKREDRWSILLRFNREAEDTVTLEPLGFSPPSNWLIHEPGFRKDSFKFWIRDSLFYKRDSLKLVARYFASDSLMTLVPFEDTLDFVYREQASSRRRRNDRDEEAPEREILPVRLNAARGEDFDIYQDLVITVNHPVGKIDTSRIGFTYREDTLDLPADYTVETHPRQIRSFRIKTPWKEEYIYDLNLYPGAVGDIYGLTNDTLTTYFTIRPSDYYGKILVSLTGVEGDVILQVIDRNDRVVAESITRDNGTLEFEYLEPVTYTLKIIKDANGNGRWDTGDYLEGIQPETILFHEEEIRLRSNFDYEVNWDISR